MTRTISLCMSIDGFLRNNRYPRDFNIFQTDDGKPMPPAAALAYLHTEKAIGHKVIPCSAQCGNPCKHPSCAGFDYAGGGCPGRLTTPPLRQEMT